MIILFCTCTLLYVRSLHEGTSFLQNVRTRPLQIGSKLLWIYAFHPPRVEATFIDHIHGPFANKCSLIKCVRSIIHKYTNTYIF